MPREEAGRSIFDLPRVARCFELGHARTGPCAGLGDRGAARRMGRVHRLPPDVPRGSSPPVCGHNQRRRFEALDPSKSVTYGQLIGGKKFNVTLTGGNINAATGAASVKPVEELKNVGLSPQRYDIPAKVDGSLKWAVDVKLPGMVHARNVKPPLAGAKLMNIDESSVRNIPGFIKVVSKGNYVAVVCEREEQAINAARQLKVSWEKPATAPFPASEDLFKYMRAATPTSSQNPIVVGNPDTAFA